MRALGVVRVPPERDAERVLRLGLMMAVQSFDCFFSSDLS